MVARRSAGSLHQERDASLHAIAGSASVAMGMQWTLETAERCVFLGKSVQCILGTFKEGVCEHATPGYFFRCVAAYFCIGDVLITACLSYLAIVPFMSRPVAYAALTDSNYYAHATC